MDSRVALLFLCVLIAQAGCASVQTWALNATTQMMREDIRTALGNLTEAGVTHDISCDSLKITEHVGSEQQPLTADHLSYFRCFIEKMTGLIPALQSQLTNISQLSVNMEDMMRGEAVDQDCTLPTPEHDMDRYVHARCVLELLDQRVSKTTNFVFTASA